MTEAWSTPTDDEVALAVGALTDENLKRVFFVGLENPNWLTPLNALGVFDAEPPSRQDGESTSFVPWVEGEYLVRVASTHPDLVLEILLRHSESRSPWVQRVVIESALQLPAEHAARLIPQICRTIESGEGWLDAAAVVSIAEAVSVAHPRRMHELLQAAFAPIDTSSERQQPEDEPDVRGRVDDYWYQELAPRIASLLEILGLRGLKVGAAWLRRGLGLKADHEDYDVSHVWRPSVAPHEQNAGTDPLKDALVDIVRDVSRALARDGVRAVVDTLREYPHLIFDRIALDATASVLESSKTAEILAVATDLLTDVALLSLDSRPEYVRLALAALPSMNAQQLSDWQSVIDRGDWQGSDAEIRRMLTWREPALQVNDGDVAAARRRFRYRLLLPLDVALPPDLRKEVAEMRRDLGPLEHPEFGSYMTSFVGPTSPVSAEDLSSLSSGRLREFLRLWKPSESDLFGPSLEGLARQLSSATETSPELVATLADELLDFPRAIVRAAIEGWSKALKQGFVPTDAVWRVVLAVAEVPDDGREITIDMRSDDPTWRWAQLAVANFVWSYLGALDNVGPSEADRLWHVLRRLAEHPDPTPEHEGRYGGTNMDALTLSLNTVRPSALRGIAKLVHLVSESGDSAKQALVSDALQVLSRHADVRRDPSAAVAAVLGEQLGHLWDANRAWVDNHRGALLNVLSDHRPTRERSDVVVSVALRTYAPGPAFIELMRPVLLDMFSQSYLSEAHVDGWRTNRAPLQVAATHVLTLLIRGNLETNDPLYEALVADDGPRSTFADALGTLGWSLMRAKQDSAPLSPSVLERAKLLIDSRVERIQAGEASASELAGFHWWVRSDVYPPSWWLPILRLASSADAFDARGMVGEALARASAVAPAQALEVFRTLLDRRRAGWDRHDLLRHAPRILVSALTTDDPTRDAARAILDQLGREGEMALLAQVDELMRTEH